MSDVDETVASILEQARLDTSDSDVEAKDAKALRAHFSKLERDEIARLKKIIASQEDELSIYRRARRAVQVLDGTELGRKVKIPIKRKTRPLAFQLHLSDTHSHELVTLGLTSGRNEHNPDIGASRLASVMAKALENIKAECARGRADPVHLTVWGGGDWMVNADLHYKMERCVDDEPLVEMEKCYQLLRTNLADLYRGSPCDSNSFVGSFSNHGRDTAQMAPGLEAARSYDTHIYNRLAQDFDDVDFTVGQTPWTVEEVCGFRTCYTHGHPKKSNVKRTSGGIMVPNWKFIMEHREEYKFNAYVQGHHHVKSVLWSDRLAHIQNGSLVGENTYSHSEGFPPEPASQNLVVVDLERGVVEKVIALYPDE